MKYEGIADEILYYGEKSKDGRWIIPIEVDWDYTLTKCSSWKRGEMELNRDAFPIMRKWIKKYNVGFILNTMRHDEILKEPLSILEKEDIKLYGLRKNPCQNDDDEGITKAFAIMSIDDRNACIPHKWLKGCNRPYVDWKKIDKKMTPILESIYNTLKTKKISDL